MKITVKSWRTVAHWHWTTPEDDVCGICRAAFDATCPDCKIPGDDCPLLWGECSHVFHMHCIMKWLENEASHGSCPMDRRTWKTAGAKDNAIPATYGQVLEPSSELIVRDSDDDM